MEVIDYSLTLTKLKASGKRTIGAGSLLGLAFFAIAGFIGGHTGTMGDHFSVK
jgi:hypothetical protein